MKKFLVVLVAFVATLLCAPTVSAQTPRCNVGADPQDINRQPTANEEVIPNPTDKTIVYQSGSGKSVRCVLQAGVPIVISRDTGVVQWVWGCGNNILTPLWIPKRLPAVALPSQGPKGEKGDKGDKGDPGIASSSSSSSSSASNDNQPWVPYPVQKQGGCGTGCKVFIAVAVVGGAAAAICLATHGGKKDAAGSGPGGVTGLPFVKVAKGVVKFLKHR